VPNSRVRQNRRPFTRTQYTGPGTQYKVPETPDQGR
jgi:hypothetical protein